MVRGVGCRRGAPHQYSKYSKHSKQSKQSKQSKLSEARARLVARLDGGAAHKGDVQERLVHHGEHVLASDDARAQEGEGRDGAQHDDKDGVVGVGREDGCVDGCIDG